MNYHVLAWSVVSPYFHVGYMSGSFLLSVTKEVDIQDCVETREKYHCECFL